MWTSTVSFCPWAESLLRDWICQYYYSTRKWSPVLTIARVMCLMIFIPVPDAVRHTEGCLSATLFYINCTIKNHLFEVAVFCFCFFSSWIIVQCRWVISVMIFLYQFLFNKQKNNRWGKMSPMSLFCFVFSGRTTMKNILNGSWSATNSNISLLCNLTNYAAHLISCKQQHCKKD